MHTSGERVLLLKAMVAGLFYRTEEERSAAAALVPGDQVQLVPEPENPHDKLAVKVMAHRDLQKAPTLGSKSSGYHIGFLPKGLNVVPHRLLVAGFDLEAVVLPADKEGVVWISISLVTDDAE